MTDLTPSLDIASALPMYEQLYRAISRDIMAGKSQAAPGSLRRALSRHLGISEQTVNNAYSLEVGFITTKSAKRPVCGGAAAPDFADMTQPFIKRKRTHPSCLTCSPVHGYQPVSPQAVGAADPRNAAG